MLPGFVISFGNTFAVTLARGTRAFFFMPKITRKTLNPATVRLLPSEFEAIDAAASLAGTTRSALMRTAALSFAAQVTEPLKK